MVRNRVMRSVAKGILVLASMAYFPGIGHSIQAASAQVARGAAATACSVPGFEHGDPRPPTVAAFAEADAVGAYGQLGASAVPV